MLIAHVSDFHVFADAPETSLVRPDAAEAAARVIADLAAFSPRVDAVAFTGDLTDGGSARDYALLKRILAPLSMPVLVVPGNHDRREGVRAAFGDSLPFAPHGPLDYELQLGDVRVLALDTLHEGRVEGRLESAQLDWLADRLAQTVAGLTLILMHHPAFPSGMPPLDAMALREGRAAFGRLVAACPGPVRILSGHIHRPFQTLWQGAYCAVGGSPAFHHDLRLEPGAPEPGAAAAPYCYYLHQILGPESVILHNRFVTI